jgi:hypothetical protein
MIDYIFHIVDGRIELVFFEVAFREFPVEIGQVPQGVFVTRNFFASISLNVFGPLEIFMRPSHKVSYEARLLGEHGGKRERTQDRCIKYIPHWLHLVPRFDWAPLVPNGASEMTDSEQRVPNRPIPANGNNFLLTDALHASAKQAGLLRAGLIATFSVRIGDAVRPMLEHRSLTIVIAGIILPVFPLFAASPFTVEQALSSPFPSDLVASPDGDAVAWVMDAKGVRNIWVARAPAFEAAPVTQFTADDGQELDEIAWGAGDSALFFTRGGAPNRSGEFPNPQSNPNGVHQEVWAAPIPGAAHKLGDGHGPAVAPDGSTVAWILSGQIWSAGFKGETKAVQLIHARGTAQDLSWSPDSTRLAFTSSRGDHAFIGVYDTRDKTVHFVDASVDRDQSAEWSPDGRRIAFIRVPAARDAGGWGPRRTAEPWSIRLADAKTGEGHEIWRAREGMGSVFWPMVAAKQLFWGDGSRIVFPWERDGWLHLFSVPSGGG